MKSLLKFLSPYKKECIIAPAFKMLEALFELFVPLVMTRIIDVGIKGQDKTVIYQCGAILVGLGLIGLTCSLIAQFYAAKAAIGFAQGVRNTLYEKILGFSYENIDSIGTSSLITRITNDINQVQNGVNQVLRLLLRSPFIVFGAMIMAFTINVKAALIFVLVIPILFIAVFFITLVTIPMYKKIQKSLDLLTGHIRENLSGVRVIRAFSRGNDEKEEFDKENETFYNLSMLTSRISTLLNPLTLIIVNLALLVLLMMGADFVNDGTLTNGQIYALVNYMSQILVELVKLSNLIIIMNKSLASAARISDTLFIEQALSDDGDLDAKTLSKKDPLISFENVSFSYPGAGDLSLENVTFDINEHETVGIIGGTGSGKSTVANLIMRFYDPTSGSIKYNGTDLKKITLESLRNVFSLVPQKAQLFTGTLKSNLLLANPAATDEDMLEAVRLSVSTDIIDKKENGIDFYISEGGANLSGGQKQRLSIARALTRKSEVLILDDSSSALDYKTDATLRHNLKELDNTVIIISQRIVSIKDADKILVFDDGHLSGVGTHSYLYENCPVYREICESQGSIEGGSL